MDFIINIEEMAVLTGLPHLQQLAYLRGIRPYMDVKTGLVGIKRRISYQSIAEEVYVEPHQGIKTQSFSRDQIRRAVSGLVRIGLLSVRSEDMHLILKCELATRDYAVQNKAAINPPQKTTTNPPDQNLAVTGLSGDMVLKDDIVKHSKAATPLIKDNYLYFLLQQFEQFWSLYPEKKSKPKAQAVFEALNPDQSLFQKIIQALEAQIFYRNAMTLQGRWVPPWKYPANWLSQRSWEDESSTEKLQENTNAIYRKNNQKNNTKRDLFAPPDDDVDEPARNNVIPFQKSL